MIKESKCCADIKKKTFEMTKKNNEVFEKSTKCWICDHVYVFGEVKIRDYCYITGKYRGSAHSDCNINVNLNHKIPIVFLNLKNYNSHLIMQELSKLNFEINVIPNGLEIYMSFNVNNNSIFIDSFKFLNSSLNRLFKNLDKIDFKYLCQLATSSNFI